jgi:hypothetical protein
MAGAYRTTSCGLTEAMPASLPATISAPASYSRRMFAAMAGRRASTSGGGASPGTATMPMVAPTTVTTESATEPLKLQSRDGECVVLSITKRQHNDHVDLQSYGEPLSQRAPARWRSPDRVG